jgi:hypothetical protein
MFHQNFLLTYKSPLRYDAEDQLRHIHRRENLKSHTVVVFILVSVSGFVVAKQHCGSD